MKRFWVLCLMALLSACGTGGSGGSSSGTSSIEVQSNSPTGKVDLNIKDAAAKSVALAPAATNVRVVITNPNLNISGAPFKYIIDGALPAGNKITGLKFPIAKGYTFEVVTYVPATVGSTTVKVNRLLKYDKVTNVGVALTDTSIDLAPQPITATFALPTGTIYSGATLGTIAATLQSPTALQPAWNLFLKTDATQAGTALHATTGQSSTHTSVKAPYVLTAGNLYAQGEFYINGLLLDTSGNLSIYDPTTLAPVTHQAERYTDWTFNYPNPDFGDSADLVKAPLDVHGLDVNIPTGGQ